MIRMIQSCSAGHAKSYFADALSRSDYYLDGQELEGRFQGKLAERLHLSAHTTKEEFFALCENREPATNKPLTPRNSPDRTVGYDINFHCPKSVSILHALAEDGHILEAFETSVRETMSDIEADAQTRVRKDGEQENRHTGELAWAEFTHQTSRPVADQAPDPHLHSHCFVFNSTWDAVEGRFKAAQFRDIKRDMPYYQARFHKRLSDRMIELGYQVRLTDKSFEIEGVPPQVINLFSKRTDEIGRAAQKQGITNAKELDGLGARSRARKQKGLSMADLKRDWKRQMQGVAVDSATGDKAVRFGKQTPVLKADAKDCVEYALAHHFERASVMQDRRLLTTAFRQAMGDAGLSLHDVDRAFADNRDIIRVNEKRGVRCTTREVLGEEKRMVDLARAGRNRLTPLYTESPLSELNGQQAKAISHILTTSDRVSIVRGAAGTGKTTLMKEAVRLIEETGRRVTVVAPTAQASRGVLKEEGFAEADTVARLLVDKAMQEKLQGQVLWVDEAGLLGTKDMAALLELADSRNARLILGGDTKQHASVVRGDALRILNTVGGIAAAEVSQIYRQRPERYREAVSDLSKGNVAAAFKKLDDLDAIKTIDAENPNAALVNDYMAILKQKKTALVISPTHRQGEAVTQDIRERLRQAGRIAKCEVVVPQLESLNLTAAQKSDWRNYAPGQTVVFNQHGKGVRRGSAWTVHSVAEGSVNLTDGRKTVALPNTQADRFDVFRQKELALSKGDSIRITRNTTERGGKRLTNGQSLDVVSVNETAIVLRNAISKAKYEVETSFGHLAHAYCSTSHAAQGKTVDHVLIAQPSATFAATDAKQFYVSVSRGREAVTVYTDDKAALLEHAAEAGDRQSASELTQGNNAHLQAVEREVRRDYAVAREYGESRADLTRNAPAKDNGYEPGF